MNVPTLERSEADGSPTDYPKSAIPAITPLVEEAVQPHHWALVPLLAIAAYITVLRIGFLSDDLTLLAQARTSEWNLQTMLPVQGSFLYRPVGWFLIWLLGWQLWGDNPLPYHLQGLLMHAGCSLTLGLWLSEATSQRSLGWLAGALFAVFPLHLEAVGWLAAQWDVMAVLFGLLSLYCFILWWRRTGGVRSYSLSLIFYGLALFTKDSMLSFLPLLGLSAWFVTHRFDDRAIRRLIYALLPFCVVLALNVGLRLSIWDNLGGYPGVQTYYANFWDNFLLFLRLLIAPINPAVLGNTTVQMVGALSSLALVLGLISYGRISWRLLFVAGVWITLALVPVLNLPPKIDDLQQNRFLYLAAAGYCVGLATLLHSALTAVPGRRKVTAAAMALLIVLSAAICWAQLRPWHTASVQVAELSQELDRLIPRQLRPNGMVWYVENVPDNYQGAYLYRLGLGMNRDFSSGDLPVTRSVGNATNAVIAHEPRDAFALRFDYSEDQTRFHVDYASGITGSNPPPSGSEAGANLSLWDFRKCAADPLRDWQVEGAQPLCEPDKGLVLGQSGEATYMVGSDLQIAPLADGARFVRLRVSARYPPDNQPERLLNQWFWHGPNESWSEDRSRAMLIRQDGQSHVYWTFLPTADTGDAITGLRFDPVNASTTVDIQWIAVDLVK